MRITVSTLALIILLFPLLFSPAFAQSEASTDRAISGASKKLAKRVVLPVAALSVFAGSAHAYERDCQHVPEDDAFWCTASSFTQNELKELKELGHDLQVIWVYVLVPSVVEFWDENGEDIKEGARASIEYGLDSANQFWVDNGDDIKAGTKFAAETAADAAVAIGDKVWNWLNN